MIIKLDDKRKKEVASLVMDTVDLDTMTLNENDMSMHNAVLFFDKDVPKYYKVTFKPCGDQFILMATSEQIEELLKADGPLMSAVYFCGPVD